MQNSEYLKNAIVNIANKHQLHDFVKTIEKLKEDLSISIALLGEFSSGKSTLANALLRKELLPTTDKPTTAKITEIIGGNELSAKVVLENDDEQVIDIVEIGNYILSPDENIKKVILEIPESGIIKKGYKLVDTPGINSVDNIHSDITFGYLPFVDAAIIVIDINYGGFSKRLINFLEEKILNEQDLNKIIIVLNKTDMKAPKEVENIVNETKESLKKIIKNPIVIPVSSKKCLESGDLDSSGINDLISIIEKEIIEKKEELLEERFYKELNEKINVLILLLKEKLKSLDYSTEELDNKIEKIKNSINNLENKQDEISEKFLQISYNVQSYISELSDKFFTNISDALIKETEDIEPFLNSMITDLINYINIELTKVLTSISSDLNLNIGMDDLKQVAINSLEVNLSDLKGRIDKISSFIQIFGPQVIQSVGKKILKTTAKEGIKKAAKGAAKETVKKVTKEIAKETSEKVAKKTLKETGKDLLKKFGPELYKIINKIDVIDNIIKTGLIHFGYKKDIKKRVNSAFHGLSLMILNDIQKQLTTAIKKEFLEPVKNLEQTLESLINDKENIIAGKIKYKEDLENDIKKLEGLLK